MSTSNFAQDLLIKRDSSKIEVKIVEINPTEISYKLFSYLDGPLIVIHKNEVHEIIFQNGQHETFQILENTNVNSSVNASANFYKVARHGVRHYKENNSLIDERQFKSRVKNYPVLKNKEKLNIEYAKQTRYRRAYKTMFPVAVGAGALALFTSVLESYGRKTPLGVKDMPVTTTLGVISLSSFGLGINFGINAKKQKINTIKVYNGEN